MGWSYSAAAGRTLNALEDYASASFGSSNSVSANAFFELDNVEHDDGRITGEVVSMAGEVLGPFQIASNGRIKTCPVLDRTAFHAFCKKAPRAQHADVANLHESIDLSAFIHLLQKIQEFADKESALECHYSGTSITLVMPKKEGRGIPTHEIYREAKEKEERLVDFLSGMETLPGMSIDRFCNFIHVTPRSFPEDDDLSPG